MGARGGKEQLFELFDAIAGARGGEPELNHARMPQYQGYTKGVTTNNASVL